MITLGLARQHLHRFTVTDETAWRTPYIGDVYTVRTCACGHTERSPAGGTSRASRAAVALIERVADELGKPSPLPVEQLNGSYWSSYGSGWWMELPAVLSQVIDQQGEAEAERQLRAAFAAGDSGVVTRPALGY